MTDLTQITASAGADVPINQNFQAVSPAAVYGRRYGNDTGGLDLGLYGGRFEGFDISDLVVSLDPSEATLYVVAARADGSVSFDTADTDWLDTTDFFRIGIATTGPATVIGWVDHREAYAAPVSGGGGGAVSSVNGQTGAVVLELDDLDDVNAPTPSDGDVLTWDNTAGEWVPDAPAGGGAVASVNGATGVVVLDAADIGITDAGSYFTGTDSEAALQELGASRAAISETIDDRVAALLVAGTNITLTYNDGAGTLTIDAAGGGGGGSPGGSTTQVQFNDGGAFGGDADFTWDKTNNVLTLAGKINTAKGTDIARATTTDIGAATGNYVELTGTTTVTGLGTVTAGAIRLVRFAGAGTLTHNGTSLILPGAASITTAANDTAIFVSLGSGNWRCIGYSRASGLPIVNPTVSVASLTNWTGSLSTTTPNNLTNAARLLVTGGTTDGDAVISPKGTGGFMLQLPDGTTTGGDKRGTQSVDLQMSRGASTQVASGQYSFAAGAANTASGYASVAEGEGNAVSATYGTGLGNLHTVSGYGAAALGGSANVVDGQRAATLAGNYLHTRGLVGLVAFGLPAQTLAAANRKQGELLALGATTTNATPVQMGSEGNPGSSNNQFLLNNNSVVTVQGSVSAMDISTGDVKGWVFSATVKRGANAAATALVGTPTVTVTGNDAGAASWAVAIVADTTYGGLGIRVTGQAAKSIEWTAVGLGAFNSQ